MRKNTDLTKLSGERLDEALAALEAERRRLEAEIGRRKTAEVMETPLPKSKAAIHVRGADRTLADALVRELGGLPVWRAATWYKEENRYLDADGGPYTFDHALKLVKRLIKEDKDREEFAGLTAHVLLDVYRIPYPAPAAGGAGEDPDDLYLRRVAVLREMTRVAAKWFTAAWARRLLKTNDKITLRVLDTPYFHRFRPGEIADQDELTPGLKRASFIYRLSAAGERALKEAVADGLVK